MLEARAPPRLCRLCPAQLPRARMLLVALTFPFPFPALTEDVFRERRGAGERDVDQLPPTHTPTRHRTHKPVGCGVAPQPTEPPARGLLVLEGNGVLRKVRPRDLPRARQALEKVTCLRPSAQPDQASALRSEGSGPSQGRGAWARLQPGRGHDTPRTVAADRPDVLLGTLRHGKGTSPPDWHSQPCHHRLGELLH